MKAINKTIYVLVTIMSILSFSYSVKADSNDFSIVPVLPENQNANVPSYFDLMVTPNQKQNLKIKIINNSSENTKYNIYVNTATTNQNGILDYSISDFDKDNSMKVSVKDCINLEEEQVEVPAKSSKEVSFTLSVPEISFEGVALGGITVEPIIEESEEKGVNSVFTRTLAIQLAESKTDIAPQLEGGGITVSQENLRNNVKFGLRNISPVIVQKVKADITITKQGGKTPIVKESKEQLSFAPNSKFSLMTQWEKKFEPGNYNYHIALKDGNGHSWEFEEAFEIKNDDAKKLNAKSVDEEKKSIWKYLLISLLIVVAIISIIYVLVTKKKKER
ncbi:DUF916 and DUF3324 domain-containing protein [Lactococcus petauri]|uniref:DUF916 and DUF3324 domain-containing protein n=1 Tax=Lactococcus petauri TaxID=1940789 RepID=UPI002551705D|nr:DUF916 and DUF3324 domain-containing protein [Lactococcus petauri]